MSEVGPLLLRAEADRQRAGPGAGEPGTSGEGVCVGGRWRRNGRAARGMEHRDTDGMLRIAT